MFQRKLNDVVSYCVNLFISCALQFSLLRWSIVQSFLFPQKLESQMRDVAYGTKQYKAAPLEVIQYTEINKCIKTKMLLLKKRKNESLGCTSSIQGWFSLRTELELYSEVQSDAIQWNRACTVNFWAGERAKDERISFSIQDRGMGGGVKVPAPPSALSMWKSNWIENWKENLDAAYHPLKTRLSES